jgi:hypothetical protein
MHASTYRAQRAPGIGTYLDDMTLVSLLVPTRNHLSDEETKSSMEKKT